MSEKIKYLHLYILIFMIISQAYLYSHVYRNSPDFAVTGERSFTIIAANLYSDGKYSLGERDSGNNLITTTWRTPVFPIIYYAIYTMVGVGETANEIVRIIFLLFNMATIYMVYRIGNIFNYYTGCTAALLAIFDLSSFSWANNYEYPDTMLAFLMTLFLYYIIKFVQVNNSYLYILLSSFFLGMAALTKPVAYLLSLAIVLFLLLYLHKRKRFNMRKMFMCIMLFMSFQVVFVGGWKIRNYYATGNSDITSLQGQHLLFYNAAYLKAYQDGIPFVEASSGLSKKYLIIAHREGLSKADASTYYSNTAKNIIMSSLKDYLIVVFKRVPKLLLNSPPPEFLYSRAGRDELRKELKIKDFGDIGSTVPALKILWFNGHFRSFVFLWGFIKGHLMLIYLMSLLGIILMFKNKHDKWILFLMLIILVYFIGLSSPVSHDRYRAPIMPVFYFLSGYCVTCLLGTVFLYNKKRIERCKRSL